MEKLLNKASSNRQGLLLTGGGLLMLLLVFIMPAVSNDSKAKVSVQENPVVGSEDNTDPVVPEEFQDWTDVQKFLDQDGTEWYADCLSTRIGVSREQVAQYAQLVKDGHDLRFIVKSNTKISDKEARDRLSDAGVENVEQLPIRVLNGFENTRGLPSDRCNPFGDNRSQVRVSLAIPLDVNDLSKGIDQNRGVLAMCGNPWKLPPETPPVTAPPPTTSTVPRTVPPTTTTTQPCVKPPKPASTADYIWVWNQDACRWEQAPNPANQDPQDNSTSGVDTGSTPGAPAQPVTPPLGPPPQEGTPPPYPNDTGYDSGSPDGSGTPGGSTCDSSGCTGGGATLPSGDPTPAQDGSHTSDQGQPTW